MWMLTLSCSRVHESEPEIARRLLEGKLADALRLGLDRMERRDVPAPRRAALGGVLLHLLLAAGRDEEAEELAQKMPRIYEAISRAAVRWHASLDQGAMCLALNRPGRAAQAFNLVADDDAAPPALRIEALAGLAIALHGVGEYRRAALALQGARQLAQDAALPSQLALLDGLGFDLAARYWLRSSEDAGDLALPRDLSAMAGRVEGEPLLDCARRLAASLEGVALAGRRLALLRSVMDVRIASPALLGCTHEQLRWLREQRLGALESEARVEAALGFAIRGDAHAAGELLGPWLHDEQLLLRHRHSLELRCCLSKLYALQGRHGDALRLYKEFSRQAMDTIKRELALLPYSRFIERQEQATQADAPQMRLPLRYRRAYQFIMERLDDRELSIRQVAAHIDVTERALQMAFRTYLGMTPAELIRRHRMEHIRHELRSGLQQSTVIEVAERWGMSKRSTLAQNYRQHFAETPSATRRGSTLD
jgi:AraC-like DNA-binding protein